MNNNRVVIIDFWNFSPHIETTFEIILEHLLKGDEVFYFFLGNNVEYNEGLSDNTFLKHTIYSPQYKATRLLKKYKNFHYKLNTDLSKYNLIIKSFIIDYENLKDLKFDSFELGLGTLSVLISILNDSNPNILENKALVDRITNAGLRSFLFANELFEKNQYNITYIFNGRFCNYKAILAASIKNKLPYLIHERGAINSKYYLQKFVPHYTDKIKALIFQEWEFVCQDKFAVLRAKDFFVNLKLSSKNYFNSTPLINAPILQNPINKRVVYFSSSDFEFQAVGDFIKWINWENQIHVVTDLIKICNKINEIELFIRIHPNLKNASIAEQSIWLNLNQKYYKNVQIYNHNEPVNSYSLLESADLIITSGSTIGIEGAHIGKKLLFVGPNGANILDSPSPNNFIELENFINNIDRIPISDYNKTLAFAYYSINHGFDYKYYKPFNFYSGEFLGVNLQKKPFIFSFLLKLFRFLNKYIK